MWSTAGLATETKTGPAATALSAAVSLAQAKLSIPGCPLTQPARFGLAWGGGKPGDWSDFGSVQRAFGANQAVLRLTWFWLA